MIKTARQLKDLIRNLSRKNAADAQILMRNYMMERFLERISLSAYRDKFILKGGMLVAAMVGLDARSTMDLDATVKGANVSVENVENMMAATARHNELSAKIKAAEKRMAEIAVLRTHIINYAKTRDTYVAYRKAGYSKKFREEHEEEILLHQAAKEAFNELNVKKLPTVKALQAEYATLLADKKKAYGEYRQARTEMRELLTVKNNVDRVLSMDESEPGQREKDHGQR